MPTATSIDYLTSQVIALSLSTPEYFEKFRANGFKYDSTSSPSTQFDRLATHMGWGKGSRAYRRQQAQFSAQCPSRSLSSPTNEPIPTSGNGISSKYFDAFRPQGFVPSITTDVMDEFRRLAKLQHWGKNSKEYHQQWNICLAALAEDFESRFGNSVTPLDGWQDLCTEVYIDPVPPSITKCKKELKKTWINIVDLMSYRQLNRPFPPELIHPSQKALRNYSKKSDKIFPKKLAKADGFVKALLIHMEF